MQMSPRLVPGIFMYPVLHVGGVWRGEYAVLPLTFFAGKDIVDGAAADFNGDGTSDIAVLTSNGDDSGTLRLFFNAGGGEDRDWSIGPTLTISGEPVSLSPIGFPDELLVSRRGVAVTSKEGGRKGNISLVIGEDTELENSAIAPEVGEEEEIE